MLGEEGHLLRHRQAPVGDRQARVGTYVCDSMRVCGCNIGVLVRGEGRERRQRQRSGKRESVAGMEVMMLLVLVLVVVVATCSSVIPAGKTSWGG